MTHTATGLGGFSACTLLRVMKRKQTRDCQLRSRGERTAAEPRAEYHREEAAAVVSVEAVRRAEMRKARPCVGPWRCITSCPPSTHGCPARSRDADRRVTNCSTPPLLHHDGSLARNRQDAFVPVCSSRDEPAKAKLCLMARACCARVPRQACWPMTGGQDTGSATRKHGT
jgi:hypothetical protein